MQLQLAGPVRICKRYRSNSNSDSNSKLGAEEASARPRRMETFIVHRSTFDPPGISGSGMHMRLSLPIARFWLLLHSHG